MLKLGFFLIFSYILFYGQSEQVAVDTAKPFWILQLAIRPVSPITKRLKNDTTTKVYKLPIQINIRSTSDKQTANQQLSLVELGSGSYYFGAYMKVNYFKAMQFCRGHGMDLLSIETKEENRNITNFLTEKGSSVDHWWTSGSDLGEEGKFIWLSTGKSLDYRGQPDYPPKMENCLEIRKLGDEHYIWNDIPCSNRYHFICEVRK